MSCLFINVITLLYISRSNIFEKTGSTVVFEHLLITTFTNWDNLCFFNSHGTMPFSNDKFTMCVTGNVIY